MPMSQHKEIDLILVATISPGRIMPSTSCEVQAMIEAKRATCFDLNAACTGFLFALNTAQLHQTRGIYSKVLVIGTELIKSGGLERQGHMYLVW